ncbi:MAG: prepilin-type N-terminal cleavage/methylation domain-containing protein [Hydrogenophaga sp.]|nr:prepilin-type N-terminal cleavage/methylation domain-containing protein [Hydrogenophaga sp.]
MSAPSSEPRRCRQRGAGLIEVMVALLVMSFGLLAMVRLSSNALLHQKSAQVRLVGMSLAQYYAERARLNVYGFDLGLYDIEVGHALPSTEPAPDPDADDLTAAAAIAGADQWTFLTLVAGTLPDATVQVTTYPKDSARELDVWLLWRDTAADKADSLAAAAAHQCPADLSANDRDGRSCMHFRVGL